MELSALAVFLWGCAGGAVVGLALYALPWLVYLRRMDRLEFSWGEAWVTLLLVLTIAVIGGVAALIPSSVDTRGGAIKYGIGSQAILKGIVSGAREAARG